MIALTEEQRDDLLARLCLVLEADNIIVIYGDHKAGKIRPIMRRSAEVDPFNFAENAIQSLREMLSKIKEEKPGKSSGSTN